MNFELLCFYKFICTYVIKIQLVKLIIKNINEGKH